jgi:thiamine-phosphate pyrophosphorylase
MSIDRMRLKEKLLLYLVTDERPNGDELLPIIRAAIEGGATAIQLRRKHELGRSFVELGHAIRNVTREKGVLFIVNDRVDVALLVDADGVHVGQDDISCLDAKRLMGDRIVGISAETVEEALQAQRDGADYLGVGAVYPTRSKPDAGYTGIDGLQNIVQAVQIPVVAIGGIERSNIGQVMETRVAGVAVVSAIMSAQDPRQAASDLRSLMNPR